MSNLWRILRIPITILLIIIIFLVTEHFETLPTPSVALEGNLTKVEEKVISLLVDGSKLFMSWSIAMIGVVAFFVKLSFEKEPYFDKQLLTLSMLIIVSSITSIFFGHLILERITLMLALDMFDIFDAPLKWYLRLQYYAFLSSLLFVGWLVYEMYESRCFVAANIFNQKGG